ncbi:MAG: O-antigen ligase family protein [Patescibacteria group bacterium]|mgnify:CR=1 FL=1
MSQKFYLIILKAGVYLSFLSVFLVLPNLLFPFITSKQIFFNILMEILTIFWLALIIKYPRTMPKKSWITFGLTAFFSALLISSIFGVDFNLSFWGDIERMLGWFHIFHFFLFYLIIITVFRDWNDWRDLFIVSIIVSTIVCLYSIFKIPHSVIGNTAYVSGYAIFNIYFALILFFRRRLEEKNKKQSWFIGALYLIAAFIMLLVMKATNTRGAYVGLGVSFLLFFILFIFHSKNKKVKIYSILAIAFGTILILLIFLFPQSQLVKNTPIINRIVQISSDAVTFQTRLISWGSAVKDFRNHPFIGTGYGNFAITFDKYFDPKFYNYTTSETYFDRAHNNLIDIASTAGFVSLFFYLSIFVAVLRYLFQGKKQNKIFKIEFILLLCLFVAYFIQNLAVFDSLVTYISLMITLGYVYWLVNQKKEEESIHNSDLNNKEIAVLFVAGFIFLSIIYQYNIKVWQMLDSTIAGHTAFAKGDVEAGITAFQKALSYKTVLDRDSRTSLINLITANPNILHSLSIDKRREFFDFVIKQAEENIKYNQFDSMAQMQLAQIFYTTSMSYTEQKDKFHYFSERALEAINKSIAASPGRITTYPTKAQIYISIGEKDKAIETLNYAISLNKEFIQPYCILAKILLYYKDNAAGFIAMDKCLGHGEYVSSGNTDILKFLLNHYLALKDWTRVVALYQEYAIIQPKDPQILIELAKTYKELGDKDKATASALKAVELDQSLKSGAEKFISGL